MKIKKLFVGLAVLTAITGAMAFTACTPNNPNDNPPVTGELKRDENGNIIFKDVELKLATVVSGSDRGGLQTVISKFNNEYDGRITIIPSYESSHKFEENVGQRIKYNNNAPDIIMSHNKSHKSFADVGYIQALDPAMETSGITISKTDYSQGLVQYSTLGTDKMYNVPIDAQSYVVYYNKQELAKIDKQLPTNRTELLDVCAAYKTVTGNLPISWAGDHDFWYNYLFNTALIQNGAELYNTSTYRAEWTSEKNLPAFNAAVESVRELYTKEYASSNISESDSKSLFINNRCLFYVACPWDLNDLVKAYAQGDGNIDNKTNAQVKSDVIGATSTSGWFAMDATKPCAKKVYGEAHAFAMTKVVTDIEKQAAVLEFIKYFTQNGAAGATWGAAGHVSASKIITASDEYKNNSDVQNFITKFYPASIDDFECIGITPYYAELTTNLKTMANAIFKSGSTDVEAKIRESMKKFNDAVDFAEM